MIMARNLALINEILTSVYNREIVEGEPTSFVPEGISDKNLAKEFAYFGNKLAQNGFMERVEVPGCEGVKAYRITWKGLCFLDLYEIAARPCSDSLEALVADIALASFD